MSPYPSKVKVTYSEIDELSRNLAKKVKEQFNPDVILAVGGGGFIPARIMRTVLNIPMYAIMLASYSEDSGSGQIQQDIKVSQWINPEKIKNKRVLIVDEVDDTRKTINYIVTRLITEVNQPENLGVAIIHNKIKDKDNSIDLSQLGVYYNQAKIIEDVWVQYPWD